jgi:peptidoglycan/LPS O-acetylase OafA/YrhL/protein involved in polysaccharide export with SLBB domain
MTENIKVINRGFSQPLLSLRGFAAVIVLINHGLICFKVSNTDVKWSLSALFLDSLPLAINSVLATITHGTAAVTFFFVHSGFVLGLSLSKIKSAQTSIGQFSNLMTFFCRRLFRLQPLIIFSILMNAVYFLIQPSRPAPFLVTTWFLNMNLLPVTTSWMDISQFTLKSLAIAIGLSAVPPILNPVLWSMRIEILGSLFLPLFFWIYKRGLVSFLILLGIILQFLMGTHQIVGFMFCFLAGLLLIGSEPRVKHFIQLNRMDGIIAVSIAGLMLAQSYSPNWLTTTGIEVLFSCIIVYALYYGNQKGFFYDLCNHPFSKWMGEISYSLYVSHFLILRLVVQCLLYLFPSPLIAAYGLEFNLLTALICLILTLPFSYVLYRWIELPFIKWGKYWSGRIQSVDYSGGKRFMIGRFNSLCLVSFFLSLQISSGMNMPTACAADISSKETYFNTIAERWTVHQSQDKTENSILKGRVQALNTYILGPGDTLSISIPYLFDVTNLTPGQSQSSLKSPQNTIDAMIDDKGEANLPPFGTYHLAGMMVSEVSDMLKEMARYYLVSPVVYTALKGKRPFSIYVNGEVRHPGVYQVLSPNSELTKSQIFDSRLSSAITQAEGVLPDADVTHVHVRNTESGKDMTVNLVDLLHGDTLKDEILEPNDVVMVPKLSESRLSPEFAMSNLGPKNYPVRIFGLISQSGQNGITVVNLEPNHMTLLYALSRVSVDPDADLKRVYILRQAGDKGKLSPIVLNSLAQDYPLKPDDVVLVSHRRFSANVTRFMTTMSGMLFGVTAFQALKPW